MEMRITIQIMYMTQAGRASQGGDFPLKKRQPEDVAFEWLKEIKRKVTYIKLLKVTINGDEDITEKVLELEKAPLD